MSELRTESRLLLRLAGPAIAGQVGGMLLGVVDTAMLGHYSAQAVAAAAVANVWIYGTFVLGEGVVRGIEPIVAQAHGAADSERSGRALWQGLLLTAIASVPLALAWLCAGSVFRAAGQDPEVAELAERYVLYAIPSIPAQLGWMTLRGWLHGRTLMQAPMWIVLAANLWHALLNYALIFGHFGAPELGVAGAAISTTVSRMLNFAMLAAIVWWFSLHETGWVRPSRAALRWRELRAVLGLGIPFGVQIGLEVWAFAGAALIAGRIGVEAVASHQIVLMMAALAFMVPLGLAVGATTRVGNLIGAGDLARVPAASHAALLLAAAVMSLSGGAFVLLPDQLPRIFATDAGLIALCATILPVAAAFQIFDGVQVVSAGILRGMGRTQAPAVANAFGYYALGLPVGWWLAFERGWGLRGVWWGLASGLAFVAIALVLWIRRNPPLELEDEPAPDPMESR